MYKLDISIRGPIRCCKCKLYYERVMSPIANGMYGTYYSYCLECFEMISKSKISADFNSIEKEVYELVNYISRNAIKTSQASYVPEGSIKSPRKYISINESYISAWDDLGLSEFHSKALKESNPIQVPIQKITPLSQHTNVVHNLNNGKYTKYFNYVYNNFGQKSKKRLMITNKIYDQIFFLYNYHYPYTSIWYEFYSKQRLTKNSFLLNTKTDEKCKVCIRLISKGENFATTNANPNTVSYYCRYCVNTKSVGHDCIPSDIIGINEFNRTLKLFEKNLIPVIAENMGKDIYTILENTFNKYRELEKYTPVANKSYILNENKIDEKTLKSYYDLIYYLTKMITTIGVYAFLDNNVKTPFF